MPVSTSTTSYGTVAKTLHWLIAIAIVAMLIIGWVMTTIARDNPYKFPLFQWHKSIGIAILLLSLVRLVWRLTHRAPPLPAGMPGWEKFAARATHVAFYVLIIGMPLIGWAITSTSPMNIPTYLFKIPPYFDGIPWPNLPVLPGLDPDAKRQASDVFHASHYWGAWILFGLLVLHVAAAHKHHWFDRDDVLTRMAPRPIARLLDRMRGMK